MKYTRIPFFFIVVLFVLSCSDAAHNTERALNPKIINFTTSRTTITVGETANLSLDFTNGTGSISNNTNSTVLLVNPGDTIEISPDVTTIYTLNVEKAGASSASQSVTVTVQQEPLPFISSFTASNNTIISGQKINLKALFGNGIGTIDQGVNTVISSVPVIVAPLATTIYTLTVSDGTTQVTDSIRIIVQAPSLNDTGIVECANDTSKGLTCPQATHPNQDAEYGRDAGADNTDGNAGFSFTQLDANGDPLATKSTDYAVLPWSCVQDTITGLTWEVKTTIDGLQKNSHTYTWFSITGTINGGAQGTSNGGTCADSSNCDTEKYIAKIKEISLCGFTDWRLPSVDELKSIADLSRVIPSADIDYFPNATNFTASQYNYFSSTPHAGFSSSAWVVTFVNGGDTVRDKGGLFFVRLVRGGI